MNRETRALRAWVTGDAELRQEALGVAAAAADLDDAARRVQEWFEGEVWWRKACSEGGRVMILDIGSMWRVDWRQVAAAL